MSLHTHIEQLQMTRDALQHLSQRSAVCADAFNGSDPQPEKDRPEHPFAHTLNNQFGEVISAIQSIVQKISDDISRIEQQVLDQRANSTKTSVY